MQEGYARFFSYYMFLLFGLKKKYVVGPRFFFTKRLMHSESYFFAEMMVH
jgi:hypothetical protein